MGGAVSDDDAVVHGHEGDEEQPHDHVAAAVYEYVLKLVYFNSSFENVHFLNEKI